MNTYHIIRISSSLVAYVDTYHANGVNDVYAYIEETYLYDSQNNERYAIINSATGKIEAVLKVSVVTHKELSFA